MKKTIVIIFILFFVKLLSGQSIVSTNPQLKAAVIEGFTGINCPFCPAGNTAIQNAINNNPGKVFGIGVHAGFFANPESGQPDFRTDFGDALVSQASITGFPSATVNRHFFPDLAVNGGTGMDRSQYGTAAARIVQQPAYANIGFSSSFDSENRELTIDLEVYYVESPPFGVESNFINIAITENDIIGYQAGGSSNYSHQRVLRHFVTGQWGDEIENVSAGDVITKSYTYVVDDEWVAENCNIVAFVTETRQEIINAASAPLIDGFHNGEITPDYGRLFVDKSLLGGEEGQDSEFILTLINGFDAQSEFELSLEYSAPLDWDIYMNINGGVYYDNAELEVESYDTESFNLVVVPGNSPGVARCIVYLNSVDDPSLPEKMVEVFVVSGVDNLIVSGSGINTGVDAMDYQYVYEQALENAGCYSFGGIPGYALEEAFELEIMNSVKNLFFNIGYTVPVLTVEQTNLLTNFIDEGGNLFISGQDIGKDIMGSGGLSTAITQKMFYQNYIGAAYLNQGNDANNSISFLDDAIFSGLPGADLTDPYGEDLRPDNTVGHGSGIEFMHFPNDRAGGIRNIKNNGKIVYLSFGLEQIDNQAVRDSIILRSYKWFNGWEGESSVNIIDLESVKIYPNPVVNTLNLDIGTLETVSVEIISVGGKVILSKNIQNQISSIDVTGLSEGLYIVLIKNESKGLLLRSKFIKQ